MTKRWALRPVSRRGVGLARYIRGTRDPDSAEIAVTVADDWQGRGLGTELMHRILKRARAEGIHRFSALLEADNDTLLQLLHKIGRAEGAYATSSRRIRHVRLLPGWRRTDA